MPCLRGIEVSFISQTGSRRLSEYPHPDGSSVRLVGQYLQDEGSSQESDVSTASNQESMRVQKTHPKVSVYIASISGAQFSIRYSINNIPSPPCKYVFFKLYMNGRFITSWGIDPHEQPTGSVVRSLWLPSEEWDNRVGIETRQFCFMSGQDEKSVAEDGGLVEVQAFRARDRRSRAPRLEHFRNQEKYGIGAPRIGLLDRPEEASFYEWHLIDAKDAPFATFCFHYRSWENLKQLNLVPPSESNSPLLGSSSANNSDLEDAQELSHPPQDQDSFSFGVQTLDKTVFDDVRTDVGKDIEEECDSRTGDYFLRSPPPLFPVSSSKLTHPQPSKASRDSYSPSYLQRPLPDLPKDEYRVHSRRSSVTSDTPSLTCSIMQYVDDGIFERDVVNLGCTEIVQYTRPVEKPKGLLMETSSANLADNELSDCELPLPTTNVSCNYAMDYLDDNDSLRERHLRAKASLRGSISIKDISPKARQILGENTEHSVNNPGINTLTLSKSEWMKRTPSPLRREGSSPLLAKIWSPRPERKFGKSIFSSLHRKARTSPEWGSEASRDENCHARSERNVRNRIGNWI